MRAAKTIKTQKFMKESSQYMEESAEFLIKLEKDVDEMKKAMLIYNKVLDILNQKGTVTHEEIKEELRKDGRVQIDEGDAAKDQQQESNDSDVVEGEQDVPIEQSVGGIDSERPDASVQPPDPAPVTGKDEQGNEPSCEPIS